MFLEHQISIRMISEGSCDTEDWSKDHRNKLYYKRANGYFTLY